MKHSMVGTILILLFLLSGCGNTGHKAAAWTTGAEITEMAAIEATDKETAA